MPLQLPFRSRERLRFGRRLRRTVVCALAAVASTGLAQRAAAQNPAQNPPAPGSLSGVVSDVSGAPLPGVTVSLLGETPTARTDSAGRFALRDVPVGGHTALFRRIGYRSVEYRWAARSGAELQVAVTMTPVPRTLERVVVEAPGASRRRGTSSIAGTIADSAGHPIAGADVRLL